MCWQHSTLEVLAFLALSAGFQETRAHLFSCITSYLPHNTARSWFCSLLRQTASVRTLRAMQQHCHHQRFTDVSARARQHGILPVPCSKTLFLTGVHSRGANHSPSCARQQHRPAGNNLSSHSRQPSALVGAGRDVPGAPAEQPSSSQESGQSSSGSNSAEAAGQVAVPPPPRPPISADAAQVGMVEGQFRRDATTQGTSERAASAEHWQQKNTDKGTVTHLLETHTCSCGNVLTAG